MFLVAVTKLKIAHNFPSANVEEVKLSSTIATIVTDDLLSKYTSEPNGFSIIESPLVSSPSYGDKVFSRVNYNRKENLLSISQSLISSRPIYYHINSKGDFFCSTHISMLRKAGVTIEENGNVLPEFFVYRHVMPPRTLYKNIDRLLSLDRLCIQIADEKCSIRSSDGYEIPSEDPNIRSIGDAAKQTYSRLVASIEELNPRRNEIAVLLSGGIDSSTLCRICQDSFGINESYSTEYPFEEPELNVERRYALSGGQALGTNHLHYETTTQDYLFGLLEAISLAEEPVHHLQNVCMHLLFKRGITKDKRIVFRGLGAGGAFGNFDNYLCMKDKAIFRFLSRRPLRGALKAISSITGRGKGYLDSLYKCASKAALSEPANPIWSWHDWYGSKKWVCDYFNVTEKDIIIGRYNSIERFEKRSVYDIASLYSLLSDEAVTLSIYSKIAEGSKKILYSPFHDSIVLNYVFSVPWRLKLRGPEDMFRKEIARQCKVPEFILNRPKSGFSIRTRRWAVKGGTFEPLVPLAAKVFDEKQIRETQSVDINMAMTFWNILNYSIWKRLCIKNEPLELLSQELNDTILN